jgi:ADP-ribose pyrophosphatase
MKKIPDHAKRVFEGVLFDVYQWDQEMFDGTVAIYESLKRKNDSVIILCVSDNKILINYESQPNCSDFISVPGGNCEPHSKDHKQDAERELLEETGYTSNDWEHFVTVDPIGYQKLDWDNHVYIARSAIKTSDQKLDSGERIQNKLVTYDEFCNLTEDEKWRDKDLTKIIRKIRESKEKEVEFKRSLGITT